MQMLSASPNGKGATSKEIKPSGQSDPSEEDNPFRQDEVGEIPV